ncbi:hypothetical protein [Bacillus alkalisoli]|uniref:hypothetical protein n=1 Tax=Bacillus alkalisoli TaxID=2011008 RepID=UPI000C240529|nr:hypothetical protein [Bacillus alkalisoli]
MYRKYLSLGFILVILILSGCEKEVLIDAKEFSVVTIKNVKTEEIIYYSEDKQAVDKIIDTINKSKTSDNVETLGSPYRLILSNLNNNSSKELLIYEQSGNVIVDKILVYTSFDYFD